MPDYKQRTKMMIEKLADQSARGFIDNKWAENFIWSVKEQFDSGKELSEKQLAKIEELFEQY